MQRWHKQQWKCAKKKQHKYLNSTVEENIVEICVCVSIFSEVFFLLIYFSWQCLIFFMLLYESIFGKLVLVQVTAELYVTVVSLTERLSHFVISLRLSKIKNNFA